MDAVRRGGIHKETIMSITLKPAVKEDCNLIWKIQVKAFSQLLLKYQDHNSNPAAESPDQILQRFEQPFTDYYLIMLGEEPIGMLRVCDFGENCRLSPLCILPEYRGNGYAQRAILEMEVLYPKVKKWELDTISQEEKLCYLYEKMGYRKTGRTEHLKDGMDLVFYEKIMS